MCNQMYTRRLVAAQYYGALFNKSERKCQMENNARALDLGSRLLGESNGHTHTHASAEPLPRCQ